MPLITLTAPSGGGKTSIMKRLLKEMSGARLLRSVTTRAPRTSDASDEYLCISEAEFRAKEAVGEFAWISPFADKLYATLKTDLRRALASDNAHFATIVPQIVPTLHAFAATEGFATRVRSIYIKSPGPDVLLRRLTVDRGEPENVAMRKIEECATWDRIAIDARPREEDQENGWRPLYLFVGDRDDFEEKYLSVLKYVNRPW